MTTPRVKLKAVADSLVKAKQAKPSVNGSRRQPDPVRELVLQTRRMDQVESLPVEWLWHGRLPKAMLVLVEGDPSLGKSQIVVDIAARVSSGRPFPGTCDPVPSGAVAFICAEDSIEHTVKPRLQAAEADLSKCHVIDTVGEGKDARPIALPHDLPFLEDFGRRHGVKVWSFDPLLAFVSAEIDSHKDQSIRHVMHGLKLLAERTDATVIALRHLNKANGGAAMYRGGGSIAISASARVVLAVGRNPNKQDETILAVTKTNLVKLPRSLSYGIEAVAVGECEVSRIKWGEESDLTADDIVTRPVLNSAAGGSRERAEEFLQNALADGPRSADDLIAQAEEIGIKRTTLFRARKSIGAKARKLAFSGQWQWDLSQDSTPGDNEGVESSEGETAKEPEKLEDSTEESTPGILGGGGFFEESTTKNPPGRRIHPPGFFGDDLEKLGDSPPNPAEDSTPHESSGAGRSPKNPPPKASRQKSTKPTPPSDDPLTDSAAFTTLLNRSGWGWPEVRGWLDGKGEYVPGVGGYEALTGPQKVMLIDHLTGIVKTKGGAR